LGEVTGTATHAAVAPRDRGAIMVAHPGTGRGTTLHRAGLLKIRVSAVQVCPQPPEDPQNARRTAPKARYGHFQFSLHSPDDPLKMPLLAGIVRVPWRIKSPCAPGCGSESGGGASHG
jgi:hypothetical protein